MREASEDMEWAHLAWQEKSGRWVVFKGLPEREGVCGDPSRMDAIKEGGGMKHRWTEEELQQVKERRVRGGSLKHVGEIQHAPSPHKPQYKSKLELAWATRLEVMRRNGEIDGWLYEPFTFRLAEGKRYRVDFLAWGERITTCQYGHEVRVPVVIAYECKGWHKNYRDSLTHLKWAAQRFPFFEWKKVVRNGKSGFEVYDVVV